MNRWNNNNIKHKNGATAVRGRDWRNGVMAVSVRRAGQRTSNEITSPCDALSQVTKGSLGNAEFSTANLVTAHSDRMPLPLPYFNYFRRKGRHMSVPSSQLGLTFATNDRFSWNLITLRYKKSSGLCSHHFISSYLQPSHGSRANFQGGTSERVLASKQGFCYMKWV